MADDKLEKVIEGLEYCVNAYPKCGEKCPYIYRCNSGRQIQRDALELLKEQQEQIHRMLHQPRSVVGCYRCKWNSGTPDKPYCQRQSIGHPSDWYCADGEFRK